MNRPLEKAIYKYLQEYKKQVCKECKQNFRKTCVKIKISSGCDLKHLNEKKMCEYIVLKLSELK